MFILRLKYLRIINFPFPNFFPVIEIVPNLNDPVPMVCASTNQNFAMGSTTVPTLLMNSFAILNVMLIKNSNVIVHLTAFLRNGNAMEKEIVLMEVTKKIAQNQFVQKANFLAKILTAALEQPVLILNGFVMARMIVVTGRMKPQTSAYHVHVNRIGEKRLFSSFGLFFIVVHPLTFIHF